MRRVLVIVSGRGSGVRTTNRPVRVAKRSFPMGIAAVFLSAGMLVAEDNFTVHGATPRQTVAIARHAEEVRQRAFAEILGHASPAAWRVRCEIHVHATAAAFTDAVGGPPAAALGATSLEFTGDEASLRRIDVLGDDAGGVPDALAHEIVHVVLADHFTAGPPPRWADEGLAVLFDSAGKQRAHEDDFRSAARLGMSWSAAELMRLEEYPREVARQRVFYGQSAALVRWLRARGDAATFIRFLDDCAVVDEGTALARHYGIESTAELQRAWDAGPAVTDLGMDATVR